MSVERKRVKVLTNAPIRSKCWAYGPITFPYHEDINTIFSMICEGIKVVEVLDNGQEIVLTASNFDNDNSYLAVEDVVVEDTVIQAPEQVEVVTPVTVTQAVEVETPMVDIIPDVEVTEEPVVNIKQERQQQYKKNNKK